MLTEMENWRETLKPHGSPDRLCNQFRPAYLFVDEPIYQFMYGNRKRGQSCRDPFGTEILFPEDAPGAMPHVTSENKVCPDVTRWREYVKFPDLDKNCPDWSQAEAKAASVDRRENALLLMMTCGIFEQLHFLMGFEDTLMNFYEEPEAMHELVDAIAQWRFHWMQLLVDHVPSILCFWRLKCGGNILKAITKPSTAIRKNTESLPCTTRTASWNPLWKIWLRYTLTSGRA